MKQNIRSQLLELERIHKLISKCGTGTLEEFAEKLRVSTRTMSRTLTLMKDEFEAPIEYDPVRQSYHYAEPYELHVKIDIRKSPDQKS
jgi:hypothetical protein